MAATNKCLARSNKSRRVIRATKDTNRALGFRAPHQKGLGCGQPFSCAQLHSALYARVPRSTANGGARAMIFDRGLRRSLVALIAFTMPACADTLGPVDATDVPKRWPPGPLRDFLEGLQAPIFHTSTALRRRAAVPATWSTPSSRWSRATRSIPRTPGTPCSKASGSASRRRRSSQTSRRTGRRTCSC